VSAGDGDFLGKLDVQLVRELFDFILQLFLNLSQWIGHGCRLYVR